ncbi:MAG: hypothetical protein ABIY70_25390 [Capsulimonas sp.]|uniref:O-antigen ligase family protein n=1 Tax=Capsulimonas sp. TaxID=2494211 RepID=UPI003267A4E7
MTVVTVSIISVIVWVLYLFPLRNRFNWLWAFVGVYIIIVAGTAIFWFSQREESSNCILVLLALSTGLLIPLFSTRKIAITVICAEAFFQSVYTLYYQHTGVSHIVSGDVQRASGTFHSANSLYFLTLIALMLCMAATTSSRTFLQRFSWTVALAVVFAAFLLTWYRAAAIALAISTVWYYYKQHNARRTQLAAIGAIALLFCGMTFQLRSHNTMSKLSSDRSLGSHLDLWRIGAKVFENNFVSGVGVGSLQIPVINQSLSSKGVIHQQIMITPMSTPLLWLDEMGVLGGILLVGIVIAIINTIKKDESLTQTGLSSAWLALAIVSLTNVPFGTVETLPSTALIGVLLGVTMKQCSPQKPLIVSPEIN